MDARLAFGRSVGRRNQRRFYAFYCLVNGYVFIRNRDPLQSLGTLGNHEKITQSAKGDAPAALAAKTVQPKPLLEPAHKLTFEIAENESEVHLGGGREVRRIEARIKLRCNKQTNSGDIGVRDFHASLVKTNDDARNGSSC